MYHDILGTDEELMAKEQTFISAFKELESEGKVRLIRCRGNFPPCSVCEKCNEVLQNKSRKYNKDQKWIVLYFRRSVGYLL